MFTISIYFQLRKIHYIHFDKNICLKYSNKQHITVFFQFIILSDISFFHTKLFSKPIKKWWISIIFPFEKLWWKFLSEKWRIGMNGHWAIHSYSIYMVFFLSQFFLRKQPNMFSIQNNRIYMNINLFLISKTSIYFFFPI